MFRFKRLSQKISLRRLRSFNPHGFREGILEFRAKLDFQPPALPFLDVFDPSRLVIQILKPKNPAINANPSTRLYAIWKPRLFCTPYPYIDISNSMKDYGNHFRDLVELQIPDDARILLPRGGVDMIILLSWRLKNDDFRPSKRSRMIRIVISEGAIEDYAAGTGGERLARDARFVSWLKRQLDKFDPDHDAPLGVEPPPVTWVLTTLELNG